jgi:hypothetical protein
MRRGIAVIERYDEKGNAYLGCSCGSRWIRSKSRHNHATFTYHCPDCGSRPASAPPAK